MLIWGKAKWYSQLMMASQSCVDALMVYFVFLHCHLTFSKNVELSCFYQPVTGYSQFSFHVSVSRLVPDAQFCQWKFETLPSQGVSKACNLSFLDTRFYSKPLIKFSLWVSKVEVIWPQVVSSLRGKLPLDYSIAPPQLCIWRSQSCGWHSLQGIFPPPITI